MHMCMVKVVNINAAVDREGALIPDKCFPWKKVVRQKLAKKRPSEAVPEYVKIKHFLCGPEFANLRIDDADTGLEVVQETGPPRGPCAWKPAPEGTLETVVEHAFCDLENRYELGSIEGLGWTKWMDAEKLRIEQDGETFVDTHKEAFAKAVADTEEMIAGFSLPRIISDIEDKTDSPSDEEGE